LTTAHPDHPALLLIGRAEFGSIQPLRLFHVRPLLRDPKDDMVLEAACAASAGCIVTHNISDFDRASSLGVSILSPLQLLTIISPSSL
jgi:predicted nucleic acid-binding protein